MKKLERICENSKDTVVMGITCAALALVFYAALAVIFGISAELWVRIATIPAVLWLLLFIGANLFYERPADEKYEELWGDETWKEN